ncbi:MAG: hypothetical protein HY549_08595, partial [Elusimicrobia bacterium]|nr:hypothetical protein [Elusimicrobiota bacterium]
VVTSSFTYDVTVPTAALTVSAFINNTVADITGNARDGVSGVGAFRLAVSSANGAVGSWLSGVGGQFNTASAVYIVTTTPAAFPVVGQGNWTRAIAGAMTLEDGKDYRVYARTTDRAGNVRDNQDIGFFTYDTTPPTVSITQPNAPFSSAPISIMGLASDTSPGAVNQVRIRISTATQDWTGSAWTDTVPTWINVTGGFSPWVYNSTPTWVSGTTYTIRAEAIDAAANPSSVQTYSFVFDTSEPSISMSAPATSRSRILSEQGRGTASTPNPGVMDRVEVRVRRITPTPSNYWNPTPPPGGVFDLPAGQAENAWFVVGSTESPAWSRWYISSAALLADMVSGGSYEINARAWNKAGKYSSSYATRTTTYDTFAPETSVLFPQAGDGVIVSSLSLIVGTLVDATNVAGPNNISTGTVSRVWVQLRRFSDGQFWNGGNWVGAYTLRSENTEVSVHLTSWTITSVPTFPAFLTSGASYYITSGGFDNADNGGNQELFGSAVRGSTFSFDNSAPNTSIAYPVNLSYSSSVINIAGASSDNVLVSTISLSIRHVNSGNCYAPASNDFSGGCPGWFAARGTTTSWNYSFASQPWSPDNTYLIQSSATDMGGAAQDSVASSSFTYDVTVPTGALAMAAFINNTVANITGNARDGVSGIGGIQIAISSNGGNGGWLTAPAGAFTSANPVFIDTTTPASFPAVGQANWTRAISMTLEDGKGYTVRLRLRDRAGNQRDQDIGSFTYDMTPPSVGITQPNYPYFSSPISIAGNSADTVPGTISQVRIRISTATQDWTGSAWTDTVPTWINVPGSVSPNWSYTSTPTWVSGTSYTIRAESLDSASNPSAISSYTFVFTTAQPDSRVTSPDGTQVLSSLSQITGTAGALTALAPIQSVGLSIGQVVGPATSYFDGALFNSAVETFRPAVYVGFSSGTWSFNAPGLTSGLKYLLRSKATDFAGNVENFAAVTPVQFLYDATKPTAALAGFNSAALASYHATLGPITGSAYDGPGPSAGLQALASGGVQLRILDLTANRYWNHVLGAFDIADANVAWFNANSGSTASWSYSHGSLNPALISGRSYIVQLRGQDSAVPSNAGPSSNGIDSNFSVGIDSYTLIADTVPAVSRVVFPGNGAVLPTLATISGTVADALAGVPNGRLQSVEVSIQEQPGLWWNGNVSAPPVGTFTVTSENWVRLDLIAGAGANPSVTGGNWSFNLPNAALFQDQRSYKVRVRSRDNAATGATTPNGNLETDISSITFTRDSTQPGLGFTGPVTAAAPTARVKSLANITGTASDDFGIQYASISVRNVRTGLYWGGAAFDQGSEYWLNAALAGSVPNFTWSAAAPSLNDNTSYYLNAKVSDVSGNAEVFVAPPPPTYVVIYDTTPPSASVSWPQNNSYWKSTSTVSGSSSDPNLFSAGVSASQIRIQRQRDSQYWTGSGWGAMTWLGNVGGTNWTYSGSYPQANGDAVTGLEDGEDYLIEARAYDVAGNTQAVISAGNLFYFDLSSPTAVVQLPADSQYYNRIASIFGTATDNAPGQFNVRFPEVRIYDGSLGNCWNGTIWTGCASGMAEIWNVAVGSSSSGGIFSWSFNPTTAFNGLQRSSTTMRVDVRVRDAAGNYTITSSSFGYTEELPVSRITTPDSDGQRFRSMSAISGTAFDSIAPVAEVYVKMWYVSAGTTYYWSPAPPHWTPAAEAFRSVNNSNGAAGSNFNWSYNSSQIPDFANPGNANFAWNEGTHNGSVGNRNAGNGKTFYVVSAASDAASNFEVALATRNFIFDNVPAFSSPTLPTAGGAYSALSALRGVSYDLVSAVAASSISILSENENPGGNTRRYFDGAAFTVSTQTWIELLPSQLFVSSWSYNTPVPWVDGRHYVVQSSATDVVGNIQDVVGFSRFLYDTTPPASSVTEPPNSVSREDNLVLIGNSSDPGFTSGIDGSGSGVYPGASPTWQQGRVQIVVFRDTAPFVAGPGPMSFGALDSTGYWWTGSTWVPVSAGETWVNAPFTGPTGGWQYTGLQCDGDSDPCWVRGDQYAVWVRATDNAGNVQGFPSGVISDGPLFFISATAQSFALSVNANPSNAGDTLDLTVEAKDGPNGTGNRATNFNQQVRFFATDSGAPENMGADINVNGLPSTYTYLTGAGNDNGIHTFQIKLRKAGARTLRVEQVGDSAKFGNLNLTVNPSTPTRVQVIADFNAAGQLPAPGVLTGGSEGRSGSPRSFEAGQSVTFLVQVVDNFWNLVVSSAASVTLQDTDPNNDPDGSLVFVGSRTVSRTFNTRGSHTLQANGQGTVPNLSNPSSAVTVTAGTPQRLVVTLPGETQVDGKTTAPEGKSGTPSIPQRAGLSFGATVYAVDSLFNRVDGANFSVDARIYSDGYAVIPASQSLATGATMFLFTPIVASTHNIMARDLSSTLPAGNSTYFTPNPFTVWWSTPTKLQLIAQGQQAGAGIQPYNENPTTGGRSDLTTDVLTAGVTSNITVNLVDQYYNVVRGTTPFMDTTALPVSSYTSVIELKFLDDPNIQARGLAPSPYTKALEAGTTRFSFIPVTRSASGMRLRVVDGGGTGTVYSTDTVSNIVVNAEASPARLQVLVPVEAAVEGSISGKSGTAGPLMAGSTYTITVRAVDQFWNLTSDGRQVRIESNDPYALINPASRVLGSDGVGTAQFSLSPSVSTGNLVIWSEEVSGASLATQTVSNVVVNPSTATRLVLVFPSQTQANGRTDTQGVSGPVFVTTVGASFNMDVYASDDRFNWVSTAVRPSLTVTTNDPYANNPFSGSNVFSMGSSRTIAIPASPNGLRTAGTRAITVVDGGGGTPDAVMATGLGTVVVNPGNPTRLRTLLPTCAPPAVCPPETRRDGENGDGRDPQALTTPAGSPFTVTVDITDAFWNLTPGASQQIRLVADDPFATIVPSSQTIVSSGTFSVTPRRAGTTLIRAEMVNTPPAWGPTLSVDTATAVNVTPGNPDRLLIKLDGESFSQGSPTGKIGIPNPATAGTNYNVVVGVVDQFFNLVTGRAAEVRVQTPGDPYAPMVSTVAINVGSGQTAAIPVSLRKSSSTQFLSAIDFNNSGLSADPQSSTFTVNPALPMGLQVLLPGQTHEPGSGNYPNGGYSGSVSTPTAGQPFTVTVNLVDQYFNTVGATGGFPWVYVENNDNYDVSQNTSPLDNNGTLALSMTLVTKSSNALVRVTARDQAADRVCTANASPFICLAQSPASETPKFKVWASTPSYLQVLLPGESLVQGKCDVQPGTVCRNLNAGEGSPGKSSSTPSNYVVGDPAMTVTVNLVDRFYNKVTEFTGGFKDSNPALPTPTPTVQLSLPGDPIAPAPGSGQLAAGSFDFQITPRTAFSTYTVVAATVTTASPTSVSSAASAYMWTLPGAAHHLHFYNVPATANAGIAFSVGLRAHDQYHNQLSSGPNTYTRTVNFSAEVFGGTGIQDPLIVPAAYTFLASDLGQHDFTNIFTLKKAGVCGGSALDDRWIRAVDSINGAIHDRVTDPETCVTVNPGAADSVKVTPTNAVTASAGSIVPNNPGYQQITGQLTDAFDNPISQATQVQVSTALISGATGYIAVGNGSGGWINVGGSTTVFSNSSGEIGVAPSTPIAYFVSSVAGHSARVWIGTTSAPVDVTSFVNAQKNISGRITTTGGLATNIVFVSTPTEATVGITEVGGAGGLYQVKRKDDFGNDTSLGNSNISFDIAETAIHQNAGFGSIGTFGNTAHYGFRDGANSAFMSGFTITGGFTGEEAPFRFRYHDRMSSYSGLDPASNTGEKNRPGRWTIRVYMDSVLRLTHQLKMDPDDANQVNFANDPYTQIAGRLVDSLGVLASYRVQLQDQFKNPAVATQTVTVLLSTVTRQNSLINNYVAFSSAPLFVPGSRSGPPAFINSTATVSIPLNQYQATFYYLDTTASSVYSFAGGTKPIISVGAQGLFSNNQGVYVIADVIDGIKVTTGAYQTLGAGTTSQALYIETRDIYGNQSPVPIGHPSGAASFSINSNSPGAVRVSTPSFTNFQPEPGIAFIPAGQATTSFYLIDTAVSQPTHTLTVASITDAFWEPASSTYTVVPGPPSQIGWANVRRRLIAGTTVQYEAGVPTTTWIAAQLLDQFSNVTSTNVTYTIHYWSDLDTTWMGVNPAQPFVATGSANIGWTNVGTNFGASFALAIPAGQSMNPVYFWDTKAGSTTITAQASLGGTQVFTATTQIQNITPNQAYYLTLHHGFTSGNPLGVGLAGQLCRWESGPVCTSGGTGRQLGIVARDIHGNIAAGDSQNGQYFTSRVNFTHSGSTINVIMLAGAATYYNFAPANGGVYTGLTVQDSKVEQLRITATDQGNSLVWGQTSDTGRTGIPSDPAKRSDGDVFMQGVVVNFTDFAPESNPPPDGPIPPAKLAIGVTKRVLNVGDGTTATSPDPISMMRLGMMIQPSGAPNNLSQLRILSRPEGNLNNSHIQEISLYADGASNNLFFDPSDVWIASGAYDSSISGWHFGNPAFGQTPLNVADPAQTVINAATQKIFFVTVKIASSGYTASELPAGFGLRMPSPTNITLSGAGVGVAANNFAMATATSSVQRAPAQMNVRLSTEIAAWWEPQGLTLSSYSYVYQGVANVGFIRLQMWTDEFSGAINQIRVSHTGLDQDISAVRLYMDSIDGINPPGDGTFNFAGDRLVALSSFPVGETKSADLFFANPAVDGAINTSTKTFFLAFDFSPAAVPNNVHGFSIPQIIPLAGNGQVRAFTPVGASNITVLATPDQLMLTDWNPPVASSPSVPVIVTKLSQNDVNKPVAKMSLRTNQGSAEWRGLKLDRFMGSALNGGFTLNNTANDVTNIKIWRDADDNGFFSSATDVQVSPLNTIIHNFHSGVLASSMSATDTAITLTRVLDLFPSDNPFSGDNHRLVLRDDQTDENLKEILLCNDIDFANNRFFNCLRGRDGTTAKSFSSGTVISGPARIPIVGPFGSGGQTLGTTKTNFFVTYDINPLATVLPTASNSNKANVGLIIPNTSYIMVTAPKIVAPAGIGIPATVSLVENLEEVRDLVRVISTDTVDGPIGAALQQNSTAAVAMFTVQTDVADATLRWILIYATGTAATGGSIAPDVDLVSLWRDANNDGLFDAGIDVMVGTATFGNFGGQPLVSQIAFNPPYRVVTPAMSPAPQRFFVAYHITPTALPTDPVTQQPRTLGMELRATSFPTNSPLVDDPLQNAISVPNAYDTVTSVPLNAKKRAIIASPRSMYIKSTPYLSSSSGTFPAPILTASIISQPPGTVESFWALSSTAGLPVPLNGATTYALVDSEIISYTGIDPVQPFILNVRRGELNTAPTAHSSNTVVGPMMKQGDDNMALLRIDAWASGSQIQWSQLILNRLAPAGLNGDDADAELVKLFYTVDGNFHRDLLTGANAADVVVAAGQVGSGGDPITRITLNLNDPTIGSPGYVLITPSTKTFYLAMDVSPAARFSNPSLNPPNEVFGLQAIDNTKFVLTPVNAGHQPVLLSTSATPNYVMMPTINTATIEIEQISGGSAVQNDSNIGMIRMRMQTNQNTTLIDRIRVDRIGARGALDTDVSLIKIFRDSNDNGAFDVIDSTFVGLTQPYLISFGNDSFSSGTVTILLRNPILVSTRPAYYFVTYDISQFAKEDAELGISVANANYFGIQVPHTAVLAQPSGFFTNPLMAIRKVTSHITLGVNDIASQVFSVNQAQAGVGMLRFNLTTDVGLAPWRNLRIERGGGSSDPNKPQGRNTDVKFIKVFKDINQDDLLSSEDVNISEVNTTVMVAVSSSTDAPFDLVVFSTQGFPLDNAGAMVGGKVFVNNAELMSFSGPGCASTNGIHTATGRPCVRVVSRGDFLGQNITPRINITVGMSIKKVDIFDQNDDRNVQTQIFFNNDQFIGPTAASYFVSYDIADAAVRDDLVSLIIRSPFWIGLPRGDEMTEALRTNVTRSLPLGTLTTSYPFIGTQVAIRPITLTMSAFSIAPSGAGQGQPNVPLLQVQMRTNLDFINLSQIRFTQLGTVRTPTPSGNGDGDFSRLTVWLDNGDRVFAPANDSLLGVVMRASTGAFTGGLALVSLTQNGLPFVRVSTAVTNLFIAADIGFTDGAGQQTLGHQAGISIESFGDLIGPDGSPITAVPDNNPANRPPLPSRLVTVAPLTVPSVSVSSSLPPIIITKENPGVPSIAIGYPAYAQISAGCNNGRDPNNQRNNICVDRGTGSPLPDQSRWICADGQQWLANCPTMPPLIDVNGDRIPDNFMFGESTRATSVSLIGDAVPTRDMTGSGILDVDLNQDGLVDMVFNNGFGGFQVMLGNDPSAPGNSARATPVPDQGFVPSAWSSKSGELRAMLPIISTNGIYQVAVGAYYDDMTSFSHSWATVTVNMTSGLGLAAYRALVGSAPFTNSMVSNLTLPIPNVARLTMNLTPDTTVFTVDDASTLLLPGIVYLGSEIMRVERVNNTTLQIRSFDGDPLPVMGRGLRGSTPISHLSGEPVSDAAAIFFARFVSDSGVASPARPLLVYRPDPAAPTAPGAVQPLEQGRTSYALRWEASRQNDSGVIAYEIQERGGAPEDLAANVLWRTLNVIPARVPSYTVGDPSFPGESPRPSGLFYSYRVRGISGAGVVSAWSPLATNVNTGAANTIITGVSNYPNPFDSRKGGPAGRTVITYVLGADSDVNITIYDLLGYVVKNFSFSPGADGGRAGPNYVTWDGKNGSGTFVSKGGYIARIKVKAPGGSSTAIRKIGVIH